MDRINSDIGYTEGNVQWTTYRANVSKHTMTMSELYEFCKKVLNHANQQPSAPLTKCEGSETSLLKLRNENIIETTSAEHPEMDEDIVRYFKET